jgi:hypothetical protein
MSLANADHRALRHDLKEAAREIASRDPRVHAVGLTSRRGKLVLRAIRNIHHPVAAQGLRAPLERFHAFAVVYEDTQQHLTALFKIPGASAQAASLPEQEGQRPLRLGLQLQNIDQDLRDGTTSRGYRTVGTLGCFVIQGSSLLMLSNNHVLAGENAGLEGDRIQQPGALEAVDEQMVADLAGFAPLRFAEAGHLGMSGDAVNLVDAATARVRDGTRALQAYLPFRNLQPPTSLREPRLGEHVYKVGRTTGLTRGQVSTTFVETGPVGYGAGVAFFERSFAVRGIMGTQFSSGGDSGSAIVSAHDGALLGLLYAGDGIETYACPAVAVFEALELTELLRSHQ